MVDRLAVTLSLSPASLYDAYLAFGLGNFQLRNIGIRHEVDQGFEFA
jgi:hypothetical protein